MTDRRKSRWVLLVVVLTIIIWLVWRSSRRPIPVTTPRPPGKIAFVADEEDGSIGIYIMENDGFDPVPLTEEFDWTFDPMWSPDGRYIAFTAWQKDYNDELWVMDADGSNKVKLFESDYSRSIIWSPDSTHITFYSNWEGNYEIYVVDREGSNLVNLSNHPGDDGFPEWSPDGERIVFTSNRDGNYEVYAVDRDGSNLVNLTNHSAKDTSPEWSLDGNHIIFTSDRDDTETYIYIMNSDGTDVTGLAPGKVPAWSPDGSRIAHIHRNTLYLTRADGSSRARIRPKIGREMRGGYWSPDGQRYAIWEGEVILSNLMPAIVSPRFFAYIVNSDGSGKWMLAEDVQGLSWSPDGQYIVFSRITDTKDDISRRTTEIFVSSADGKDELQLTHNRWNDNSPAWQPRVP